MYNIELSVEQLSKITGIPKTRLEESYPDSFDTGEFMTVVTKKMETLRDEANGKGMRTKSVKVESKIKPLLERYGVEQQENVEDTLEALLEKMATPGKTGGELTLEDLRTHPLAAQLVEAETLKIKQRFEADLAQNTARLKQIERERLWAKAKAEIVPHLDNAILGQATKEQAAEMLLQLIGIDNLGENESGNVIPVKDGKPLTDDVYNPVGLGDVVKKTWSLGFNQTDPTKNGGGAPAAGSTKAGTANPYKFTSLNEASAAIERESDPGKRALMREAQIELMQKS